MCSMKQISFMICEPFLPIFLNRMSIKKLAAILGFCHWYQRGTCWQVKRLVRR